MLSKPLLVPILTNDALTRGLGDPEARILVEWLVDQAEQLASGVVDENHVRVRVQRLLRRGRGISRFVTLWCYHRQRGAACQLAAAERFTWPLPSDRDVDPCELMQAILDCEAVMN